ncbi:hypothetical protein [Pedobacter aquatilis]|uniref:hypothetical protein n=1 Tax=Pedobacter aquatilis TaxID=351343 RepID=UPI002931D089|nr:hypothetical protein [Pedobacter aquatilis]
MKIFIALFSLVLSTQLIAQKKIRDKHITHQQERMVFKQWDQDKFTPTSGFLGLNPEYWLTWGLHPNYPKTDLRPLGPVGPQSQRLVLAAAMQTVDNAYKKEADTVSNTAISEGSIYLGYLSDLDPLWQLYYKNEFERLINPEQVNPLSGLSREEKDYLKDAGLLDWYLTERASLAQRLELARKTNLEKGSRIMSYHRMLAEMRKLDALWEDNKKKARRYLAAKKKAESVKSRASKIGGSSRSKSDIAIADEILKKSKL